MRFIGVRIVGMNEYEITVADDKYRYTYPIQGGKIIVGGPANFPQRLFAEECFKAWQAGVAQSHSGTDMA